MLTLVHFVHLLAGISWAGGTFLMALALYPAVGRLGHADAQALWSRIAPAIDPVLGVAGGIAMLFGLIRAWAGGGVTSFADLGSAYGLWVLGALVLAIAEGVLGGRQRKAVEAALADPALFAAEGRARTRRAGLTSLVLMLALIAVMVVLGLGLY